MFSSVVVAVGGGTYRKLFIIHSAHSASRCRCRLRRCLYTTTTGYNHTYFTTHSIARSGYADSVKESFTHGTLLLPAAARRAIELIRASFHLNLKWHWIYTHKSNSLDSIIFMKCTTKFTATFQALQIERIFVARTQAMKPRALQQRYSNNTRNVCHCIFLLSAYSNERRVTISWLGK